MYREVLKERENDFHQHCIHIHRTIVFFVCLIVVLLKSYTSLEFCVKIESFSIL